MDLTCRALATVMEVQTMEELTRLREEMPRLKEALDVTHEAAGEMACKFDDLVWYARCTAVDGSHPGYELWRSLKLKYPKETAKLDDGNSWQHGFNSGVLATARLMMELSTLEPLEDPDDPMDVDEALELRREVALETFPNLDT